MKIIILNTQALFLRGGAEYLAESLQTKLTEVGHQAEIVSIPFRWFPIGQIPQHMLAARLIDLSIADPDLVIALKFPAYLVPFPNKKLWLLHQYRQVYELWDTKYRDAGDTPSDYRIRDMITNADNHYLREARAIYTNSKIVANRLHTYNNIQANGVLYPPLLQPEIYYQGDFDNYFFYPSRVVRSKRQEVAIEAMRYVRSNFRLVLAGQPESEAYGQKLQRYIETHHLQSKVTMLGWISDEEKARLMANACGALYIPYDEDSYGYVTLEAFHSHKPVITFTDSGGTDEVIEHEINGLMLEPNARALAEGMEKLWANRNRTIEMGHNANRTLTRHQIDWEHVLDNLLS